MLEPQFQTSRDRHNHRGKGRYQAINEFLRATWFLQMLINLQYSHGNRQRHRLAISIVKDVAHSLKHGLIMIRGKNAYKLHYIEKDTLEQNQ